MKKILLAVALVFTFLIAKSEILHRQFRLNANYLYNVEIYIPDNSGTGKLPSFVFIPGNGESNTNVNGLYVHGPLKFIRDNGWRPNFIVIGIQPIVGPAPASFVQNALDSLVANPLYRFDVNKFYGTGLSYGAAAWDVYTRASVESRYRKPAAVILFSITMTLGCGNIYDGSDYPCVWGPDTYGQTWDDFRWRTLPMWGLAGTGDAHYWKMMKTWEDMQGRPEFNQPASEKRWTDYLGDHCCWNTYYNPAWTEDGKSIYDWALQFPMAALPVTWGYIRHNRTLNQIEWSTESEQDCDYFEVEVSGNGRDFLPLGRIPSKSINGESSTTLQYAYKI